MAGIFSNIINRLVEPKETIQKNDPKSMDVKEPLDKISHILNQYESAVQHEEENRIWESQNWRMYSGFDNGQWDKEAVATLKAEGRHLLQFNFVRPKIDGIAGSILKNFYDIDFVPVDGKYSDLTMILKELYYADKELMDWDTSYLQTVIDGLIYRGVEQMVISERYNPLGNIGFERVMPGHIVFDPNWTSHDSKDLKRAWKLSYMNPKDIMDTYQHKSDSIMAQLEYSSRIDDNFDTGVDGEGFPRYNLNDSYGNLLKVIEYHHIQREKKVIEIDIASGTVIPEGSDDYKKEFCVLNNIDCSDGVLERSYDVDMYYVSTVCPELDKAALLEDRKSEIQIGRLPFFVWSSAKINGKYSGIVDLIYDIQQTINKRESLVDHMIATSANGPMAVDPQLVGNDAGEIERLKRNWNNPSYKFLSQPGELASGRRHFEEVPRAPFPSDVIQEINRMTQYVDRLSKQPASMDARNESSHETGILFARKQMQAEINQSTIHKNIERFWNEKGEAYMMLAQGLYGGAYREVRSADGKKVIKINEVSQGSTGPVVQNDIAKLPRHKVVVSQSPNGITVRATQRAIMSELIRNIPPSAAASQAQMTNKIMETLDLTDMEREKLVETSELEYQLAMKNLQAQSAQLDLQIAQMAAQAKQAANPQPAPPPEGGAEEQGAPPSQAPAEQIPL